MADATHLVLAPGRLLGVHGLATKAGASSLVFIRTPQHKGHPHPVLSRSTSETPSRAFSPRSFLRTELVSQRRDRNRLCDTRIGTVRAPVNQIGDNTTGFPQRYCSPHQLVHSRSRNLQPAHIESAPRAVQGPWPILCGFKLMSDAGRGSQRPLPRSLWQQTRAKNLSAKWRDFISRLYYIRDHIPSPRGPPASPGPGCSPKLKRFLASSVEPPGNMKYLPPRNPDSPSRAVSLAQSHGARDQG